MIKEITPDEIRNIKIISVQSFGRRWNWAKFKFEPVMFYLFTENGIFEMYPEDVV